MAGIVLAGGQSRRMGRDKALLIVDGVTLLERAVRTLGETASTVIVVADDPGRYLLAGATVVGDDFPGAGPLGGIVTGLRHAGPGLHLVIACDMPFVRGELLALLLSRAAGHDAAIPWIGGRPEPLCAAYDFRCLSPLSRTIAEGERAVHRALHLISAVQVEESDVREIDPALASFVNLNEPRDLASLTHLDNDHA